MTEKTEDFIEHLISMGVKAYKKNDRKSWWGRKLDRHELIDVEGVKFKFWRELGVYFTAVYIMENIPTANVEVCLDGNDSTIYVELDDNEQALLEKNLDALFNKYNIPME